MVSTESGLFQEFLCAISTNNIDYFKQLVGRTPRRWRSLKSPRRNTLLQLAILWHKREIFTFLLGLERCDVQYLENRNTDGKTAMHLAMEHNRYDYLTDVYCMPRLVEKYETIPDHYENVLLWAISTEGNIFKTAQSLLDKGTNPNAREGKYGPTALHKAILSLCYERIFTLLFYGANPFETYLDINAFEISVIRKNESQEQELLFEYTFDKLGKYKIHYRVLLELARLKSPLFNRILEYDVQFVDKGDDFTRMFSVAHHDFEILLRMEMDYLKIIVEKYYSLLCDIFQDWRVFEIGNFAFSSYYDFVEKLNILVESGETLKSYIVKSLGNSRNPGPFLQCVVAQEESVATEIVIFMAQYGLQITEEAFDLVYREYGYCPLFKFLLHTDYYYDYDDENLLYPRTSSPLLIVSLIRDAHLDLDSESPPQIITLYSETKLLDVLDFYANKKLQKFILREILDSEELEIPDNRKELPQIPCLLELSRDVFRSYLVRRFKIKRTKEFYRIVGSLDISEVYKKIICLETKLY